PPPPAASRRRPSMVGYVEDADVSTMVRVRFDAGFGMSAPDRAEFFYAKCGCYRGLPADSPAFDPNAPGPGPGIVTNLNFQELYIRGEYAPIAGRVSAFAELPFRFIQPDTFVAGTGSFGSQSGISDLRFGVKGGLVSTPRRQLTVSFQVTTPTGDAGKGLGTNHTSVEPALLYLEHPADRFTVEAELGEVFPIGGSAGIPTAGPDKFAGHVMYFGAGPSYEVYRSARVTVAPVVELVGWWVRSGFDTSVLGPADGTKVVNLKVGARVLAGGNSFYVGYGHALTSNDWYDNILRIEYRVNWPR
ncbi:MAG TPA: hypothetical protein VG871_04815, partial [Vicinamibacterales bacterium]|nr:hypothetical protein [Vicinamibacterales bacterium]